MNYFKFMFQMMEWRYPLDITLGIILVRSHGSHLHGSKLQITNDRWNSILRKSVISRQFSSYYVGTDRTPFHVAKHDRDAHRLPAITHCTLQYCPIYFDQFVSYWLTLFSRRFSFSQDYEKRAFDSNTHTQCQLTLQHVILSPLTIEIVRNCCVWV